MKKRDRKKKNRQESVFFCSYILVRVCIGGISIHVKETWLMAFLDKRNPQVKVQDIFPSEVYVGKCEYLSKLCAESCE